MAAPSSLALSQLQSKAQIELLDAVDKLRADGFSGELDLPQLIVCGDQSSGKSSVLEAISQVRFPAADIFCTRFASELVLRTAATRSFVVPLIPAGHRSDEERALIASFQAPEDLTGLQDFPRVVEAAGRFIDSLQGDDYEPAAFYQDKLRAVIYGPDLPPLTLVDLPGLIHTSSNEQGTKDIETVREIIESYMRQESSIILAVINAEVNLATQEVLQLSRQYDPKGRRTLGIIAKPDKVEAASPSEEASILCAQNKKIPLTLGWHVLKNRAGHHHRNASSEERDADEANFFKTSRWAEIPTECRGINALRQRLSDELLRSVTRSLPALVESINERTSTCKENLRKLGQPKTGEQEQRLQLTTISSDIHDIVKASVEGHYSDEFFGKVSDGSESCRKLRSQLRKTLDKFADHMQDNGSYYDFYGSRAQAVPGVTNASSSLSKVPTVTSARHTSTRVPLGDAVRMVKDYLRENRGCEPTGFGSPPAVAHMFKVQSSPWQAIAKEYIEKCWLVVRMFFVEVVEYAAPPHIASAVLDEFATLKLESIRADLEMKLQELLKPYKKSHLVTLSTARLSNHCNQVWTRGAALRGECSEEELGPDGIAALRSLEYLHGYYNIAMPTFTETVGTLAIENCLVEGLLQIFNPTIVAGLDGNTLRRLTAEPEEVARSRAFNIERLQSLEGISSVVNRLSQSSHWSHASMHRTHSQSNDKPVLNEDLTTPSSRVSINEAESPNSSGSERSQSSLEPTSSATSTGSPNHRTSSRADLRTSPAQESAQAQNSQEQVVQSHQPRSSTPCRKARHEPRHLANHSPDQSETVQGWNSAQTTPQADKRVSPPHGPGSFTFANGDGRMFDQTSAFAPPSVPIGFGASSTLAPNEPRIFSGGGQDTRHPLFQAA